ncbi:hypothetical protein VTL71DRAFT_15745 [Oculimacula yallundae]|uniref:Uncharacterized protein n=1 Tax=Oculimacula yallundae TaxID=86028 RepID=A0ABR4CCK7_9HELO
MSSEETEQFLRDWAATVPLPEGPGEATYVSYDELQETVESYIKCIQEESDELPVELRLSAEMQLYQARQTTVLEFWGSPGHKAFPPAPDLAAYIDNTWRRLRFLRDMQTRVTKDDAALGELPQVSRSLVTATEGRNLPNLAVSDSLLTSKTPTTPTRVIFRLPTSARKRSYRKKDRNLPESDEDQDSPQTISLRDPKADLFKSIVGAVKHKKSIAPIWPGMKIQGRWDPLTGFPAGAFVFSTDRAFRRIIGQFIANSVGQVLGTVNVQFPLLNLRWARTAIKENGRRDLAVWVELSPAGLSRMDTKALVEKEVALRGLREFHQRDLAGADECLDVFFRQNIKKFRSKS